MDEPIPPFNTRYPGKLEGIINSVSQTFDEKPLNSTVLDAAAAYFNQLVRGHAFFNGNKRMGVLFTHVFLLGNGVDYTLRYNEMLYFAIFIARAGERGLSGEITKQWCKEIIGEFSEDLDTSKLNS